jgi:DNA-binding NtrC family response regulator
VLVVDDKESVRKVAVRTLGRKGLTTVTASDGAAALEVFRERPSECAAVLLDLTMPRMGGEETLAALRELRPDLPVVLSSGYHEPEALVGMERAHAVAFIQKPYKFDELRQRIRHALTPSGAAGDVA